MALSPDELARYARHVILPEIGGAGQLRLRRAQVTVIGAGGIGSPALQYLAGAGSRTVAVPYKPVPVASSTKKPKRGFFGWLFGKKAA